MSCELYEVRRLSQEPTTCINLLRSRPLRRTCRHIVPPLGPSQPVIADEKSSCWGKEPSGSSLLSLLSFLTCFSSAHTTQAQTKLRKPQCLRTASTREQPSIGPAQRSRVHTVVRSCRPECDNASKQAWKSKPRVAESHFCMSILCFFCRLWMLFLLCLHVKPTKK